MTDVAGGMKVIEVLTESFPDIDFAPAPLLSCAIESKRQMCVHIPADRLVEVMHFLRHDERCRFELLADLAGVDYLDFPDATHRYGVVYTLASLTRGVRLWAKCFADDPDPEIPSVCSVWKGANWPEREVYDLFGVTFTQHPDMRRLLTWDEYEPHPLRKDYPLHGTGERENFEVIGRDAV